MVSTPSKAIERIVPRISSSVAPGARTSRRRITPPSALGAATTAGRASVAGSPRTIVSGLVSAARAASTSSAALAIASSDHGSTSTPAS